MNKIKCNPIPAVCCLVFLITGIGNLYIGCSDRTQRLDLAAPSTMPAPVLPKPSESQTADTSPGKVIGAWICYLHGDRPIRTTLPVNACGTPDAECEIYYESRSVTNGECLVLIVFEHGYTAIHYGSPRINWREKLPGFDWNAPIVTGNQIRAACCGEHRFILDVASAVHGYKVKVHFLLGDVRGDGFVNALDRIDVRDAVGAVVDESNAGCDVNTDGRIDGSDRVAVRDAVGK